MKNETINIYGARQNNLKNLSLKIPKYQITVFTGVSGSGKSSLVFETIGAEAQRQINETHSSFVRNRLLHLGISDVDKIEHLNVPIIINQKPIGGNSRSTVGTITDIYSSLRLLYSRMGNPFVGYSNIFSFNHHQGMCLTCQGLGEIQNIDVNKLIDKNKSLNEGAILFPTYLPKGWRWTRYVHSGYFDCDKKLKDYTSLEWELLLYSKKHKPSNPTKQWHKTAMYEGVISRIKDGFLKKDSKEYLSRKKDIEHIVVTKTCPSCNGQRLNSKILSCKINGKNIADCTSLSIDELLKFIKSLPSKQFNTILTEIIKKLENLCTIGLDYLTLDRQTNTLSGGESQRIKMVRHLGNSLENLLYIFDEPSVGLHSKDLKNILTIIKGIKDKGNTVLIVDHDPDIISIADYIVDIGPSSGKEGGKIVYQGNFENLKNSNGKTAQYFSHKCNYSFKHRKFSSFLTIKNASMYNLKNLTVNLPINAMSVVTGVAGSGKSTLIRKNLLEQFPSAKVIDQSNFSSNSRSNILTYLDIFDYIRSLFSKANNVNKILFSKNSKGACSNCKGLGIQKLDLAFMEDIEEFCEVCNGSGYKKEILEYKYKNMNIVDILNLSVLSAFDFFKEEEFCLHFKNLIDLGLDYITLGQSLNTFSGGERQRLKLSKQFYDKNTLLVLDEPTTGLHPFDIKKLLNILHEIVNQGNTVIIIEHNLDMILQADWIIDIGPNAGKYGGELLYEGTLKDFLLEANTHTSNFLTKHLAKYYNKI